MAFRKTYVEVTAHIDVDGHITPLEIIWRDGRIFPIDEVREVIRRASQRVGGFGLRYSVMVHGHEKYLYYENPRWFIEEVFTYTDTDTSSPATRSDTSDTT